MSVLHLNESEFDAKITSAPLAMVDFWATWCGPCKMLAPTIEKIGESYGGKALIAKVDVDQCQDLAARFPNDRRRYTAGKHEIIDRLLEEARRWRAAGSL